MCDVLEMDLDSSLDDDMVKEEGILVERGERIGFELTLVFSDISQLVSRKGSLISDDCS